MIFRFTKPRRLPGRRLWYYCCMVFTPPLASKFSESIGAGADYETARVDRDAPTRPYLQVVGPPPLRFQQTAPRPDLGVRPPAAAPPTPNIAAPALATAPKAGAPAPLATVAARPPVPPAPPKLAPPPTQGDAEAAAPAIIEDEMRPRVRAEEFLPFFQLPATETPGSRAAETTGQIPPSSATYEKR